MIIRYTGKAIKELFSILKKDTKKIFTGTKAEWDALSDSEKDQYDIAKIVED